MPHILLIDADKRLRETYAKSLQAAGHSVALAASAQGAVGELEAKKPELVVLELQLQGHSGVEFLQEMRSYPEWSDIPVLLHTFVPQDNLQNFKQAFRAYGIVGYTYKPETSLQKLVNLVDGALQVKV
jgi:CheY-like chemotaxis protein